jgi:3-deoxy-D-manno-octulosonic-acid transferase
LTHTLNKLSVIATQNQNSAERFIKLGANKDKVMVAGNIKFEQNPSANKNLILRQIYYHNTSPNIDNEINTIILKLN